MRLAEAVVAALLVAGGGKMPDSRSASPIPDDAFWSEARFGESGTPPEGLSLLAPAHVDLARRTTLPVLVQRRASMRDAARAPLSEFGVLVAVDVERGELWAGRANASDGDEDQEFVPPSAAELAEMGEGRTTERARADLRERLRIPWRASHLALVATLQGTRSPVREVRLDGSPAGGEARDEQQPEPVLVGAANIAPPKTAGISLAAEGGGLRGSFRIRSQKAGTAVLHLVVVFEEDGFPVHKTFRVPLRTEGGSAVAGFELGQRELGTINPGRPAWVWAFVHEAAGGPVRYVAR